MEEGFSVRAKDSEKRGGEGRGNCDDTEVGGGETEPVAGGFRQWSNGRGGSVFGVSRVFIRGIMGGHHGAGPQT